VKITIRCGVSDGGKPCGRNLGAIESEGFPGPEWFHGGNYDRLRWDERHYVCPRHGAVQIHEEDLLRRALNPARPGRSGAPERPRRVLMAKRVGTAL
jgi:hypothetical protein